MKLINETPFAAGLLRTAQLATATLVNALVVRVRHRLEDGRLLPAAAREQPMTLERDPIDEMFGTLDDDSVYPRTGTDVIVIGDAIAPHGQATMAQVRIAAGSYDLTFQVFGDRTWQRLRHATVASDPAPFSTMPLSYTHAFGGTAVTSAGTATFAHNPVGRGYALDESQVDGTPLPNIENPDELMRSWTDQPAPVGCGPYPMCWGLRLLNVVEVKQTGEGTDAELAGLAIHPERGMFDRAHPLLSGRPLGNDILHITGMSAEPLALPLPPCPAEAEIAVGARSQRRALALEEVLVNLRSGTVDLTYRKMFRYVFKPHEQRRTTLVPTTEAR